MRYAYALGYVLGLTIQAAAYHARQHDARRRAMAAHPSSFDAHTAQALAVARRDRDAAVLARIEADLLAAPAVADAVAELDLRWGLTGGAW